MVFCGAPSAGRHRAAGRAVVHARLDDVAQTARGFGEDAAFAGQEVLLGLRGAPAIDEHAVLGEIGQRLEMLDEAARLSMLQLDVEAGKAVFIGAPG
jgi:hypothetical protein